ncbi:ATP-grasp domain-containing protein [Methanothrix sp.]|uniref:ATP-grasp domain-containing protein n=1 Tax=Methanothrix sp. TaxID=90426 RepID=UPI0034E236C8
MGKIGVFVDRQTLGSAQQLNSLLKLRDAAELTGHLVYFLFPVDLKKIPGMDALFIRSRTDPMNISFVASKMASIHGIPVIDDPDSIQICSDKVNMYLHLMKRHVCIPKTVFVRKGEVTTERARELLESIGSPLVLKEPSTSFSARVERVGSEEDFLRVARRFMKLSDWIVAQEFIPSEFDWRIGVLDGEFLYACKYIIPSETFKIQATINGHTIYCAVKSAPLHEVPEMVIEEALKAGKAIGDGLYGVDLKESAGTAYVIEVNDNPSLEGGEDECYPGIYARIIANLMER